MTKKDYIAIARIIKSANDEVPDGDLDDFDNGHQTAVEAVATDLMKFFKVDNPRFDEKKFSVACGFSSEFVVV